MATEAITRGQVRVAPITERHDPWWAEPLAIVTGLGAFIVYSLWVVFQNAHYYAAPYLSPFYSPCLASNCAHSQVPPIVFWGFTPAILAVWIPLGFRGTCYYYRKAYYRAFFWSPPACAVNEPAKSYTGETRFPFLLVNIHRYFFWLALIVLVFLWWDVIEAFQFPTGIGIGLGTIIMLINVVLLSLYSISCHSARHLCGGVLDTMSQSPTRLKLWHWITRYNEHHQFIAWASLIGVALTDLYIRLVSMGVIIDPRWVF